MLKRFNIPEFLYVKSPEDLKSKSDYLENYEHKYYDIWNTLQNLISKDDLWNGSHFFNNIEKWVKKDLGYTINRTGTISYRTSSLFVKEETSTLEDFFS